LLRSELPSVHNQPPFIATNDSTNNEDFITPSAMFNFKSLALCFLAVGQSAAHFFLNYPPSIGKLLA
jgi:hypothetical protein